MILAALFIDFDNVLYQLKDRDQATAARFCNRPINWLNALAEIGGENRKIVSRRCYASPHLIQSYRRNFTHGGFEVIDTPPLTTNAKNGADILMVMDILDFVARHPHIEEYIILSGDADFVPVLNRLRRENKGTAIFAPANVAGAYRNSADWTIDTEFFVSTLEVTEAQRRPAEMPSAAPAKAAGSEATPEQKEIAGRIEHVLAPVSQQRGGEISFPLLGTTLRQALPDLIGSDWAGCDTMSAFLKKIPFEKFSLDFTNQRLIENDFKLSLDDWGDEADDDMREFVNDLMRATGMKISLSPPEHYRFVFDAIERYYNSDSRMEVDPVEFVASAASGSGLAIAGRLVRAVGAAIQGQGIVLKQDMNPGRLASVWRQHVFELADQPEWLESQEDAQLLARWFRASTETVEEAAREFLSCIDAFDLEGEAESGEDRLTS